MDDTERTQGDVILQSTDSAGVQCRRSAVHDRDVMRKLPCFTPSYEPYDEEHSALKCTVTLAARRMVRTARAAKG